ncbi:MAG: hypothetical protein ACE5KP_01950 [Dehalococcoidales bacterium]
MTEPKKLSDGATVELVEKGKLKRADILLTRSKGSLLGWLIRFGTKSYWNHAAMVYVIRSSQLGYDHTFIIESGGAGIDIHTIGHYFQNPKKYDVGIKRLDQDWFQDDSEAGGLRFRRRVRGFALSEIDDKYDHKMIIGIARTILRQLILAFIFSWLGIKKPAKKRARIPKIAKRLEVNAYICSGFVQWAYYRGVEKVLEEIGDTTKTKIQDVIFNPEITCEDSEDVLLSTTPADLANSDKLTWKYVIKDGVVWKVNNEKEVDFVLKPD